MFNLSDSNVSFILFSPERQDQNQLENKNAFEKACSILYSKDYTIFPVTGYFNNMYEQSMIAVPNVPNNDHLRKDSIYLMDLFHQESIILKYLQEQKSVKLFKDGSERTLGIALYNEDTNNKTFLHNGISFSFIEEKKYYIAKSKSELKNGMIVEYYNDNRWNQKEIKDIDIEYDNLYKLLIKYNKLRFQID